MIPHSAQYFISLIHILHAPYRNIQPPVVVLEFEHGRIVLDMPYDFFESVGFVIRGYRIGNEMGYHYSVLYYQFFKGKRPGRLSLSSLLSSVGSILQEQARTCLKSLYGIFPLPSPKSWNPILCTIGFFRPAY